jgi:hypothetical protein
MPLNLTPSDSAPTGQQAEDHGVQHVTGYGFLPVGLTQQDCKQMAESGGGYTWDAHAQACWPVYGKAVKIEDLEHSIMEGFEIVNFNFHVSATAPPVPTQNDLPGLKAV